MEVSDLSPNQKKFLKALLRRASNPARDNRNRLVIHVTSVIFATGAVLMYAAWVYDWHPLVIWTLGFLMSSASHWNATARAGLIQWPVLAEIIDWRRGRELFRDSGNAESASDHARA